MLPSVLCSLVCRQSCALTATAPLSAALGPLQYLSSATRTQSTYAAPASSAAAATPGGAASRSSAATPMQPSQQQQAVSWRAASTACDVQDRDRLVQRAPSGTPPVLVVKTAASPLEGKRIGFIGSGQMAEALTRGLLSRELIEGHQVSCSDPSPARKQAFAALGAMPCDTNTQVASSCDILFVAVKPDMVAAVLGEVRPVLTPRHTIVSIAAGVTLAKLSEAAGPQVGEVVAMVFRLEDVQGKVVKLSDAAGPQARVVRVMPNTPCLVGETAAAMCLGGAADESDEALVRQLFESVGRIYTVDEKLLSAVTGLSGSGPAYVFVMIEALADGGVRVGLPREVAQALAAQTVLGSAKMVLETGKHPGALKDMVASPGGTTIAGLHQLERAGVRAALMDAVVCATERADALSAGK